MLAMSRQLLWPIIFVGMVWSKVDPEPQPRTEPETDASPATRGAHDSTGAHASDHVGARRAAASRPARWQPDRRAGPSHSKGSPVAGKLKGGQQVSSGAYFHVRDPERAWVTGEAALWLHEGFETLHRARPGAPRATVLDASFQHGGPIAHHRSHQSGRDVDLSYLQHSCSGPCPQRALAPVEIKAADQWMLLRTWLARDQVKYIFVDHALQAPLYDAAVAAGESEQDLRKWIQYPRGHTAPGIIRHAPNHHDHLHVRFACGPHDATCHSAPRRKQRPARGHVDRLLSALRSLFR